MERINLSMDKETLRLLDHLKKISGTSKSALVRRAIKNLEPEIQKEWLEKMDAKRKSIKHEIRNLQIKLENLK